MTDILSIMYNVKYKFTIETGRTPTFYLCGLDARKKLSETYPELNNTHGINGFMMIYDLPVLEVLPPYPKDRIQVI
jgi:uncharacterized protein YcsI (UPF0317 family)